MLDTMQLMSATKVASQAHSQNTWDEISAASGKEWTVLTNARLFALWIQWKFQGIQGINHILWLINCDVDES